jgi:hypothetical protein
MSMRLQAEEPKDTGVRVGRWKILAKLVSVFWLSSLTACGGGGSPTSTSTIGLTVSISGVAIDGYLQNALVFLDRNGNLVLDSGEPSTRTFTDGSFNLQVNEADLGNYPIVVKAVAGETVDLDKPGEAVGAEFVLLTLKDKTSIVSPLTTLVAFEQRNSPGLSASQAEANVKQALGLATSAVSLFADYANTRNIAAMPELIKLKNHAPLVVGAIQESLLASQSAADAVLSAAVNYKRAIADNTIPAAVINSLTVLQEQQRMAILQTLAPVASSASKLPAPQVSSTNTGGPASSVGTAPVSNGTPPAGSSLSVSYSLSSVTDAQVSSAVTVTLVASDQSVPQNVRWSLSSGQASGIPTGSNQLRVSIPAPMNYESYEVTVTALADGKTSTRLIRFWPQFQYREASYRLPLTHEHETSEHLYGEGLYLNDADSTINFNGFDSNGWVNRRIKVDFNGYMIDGVLAYDASDILGSSRYDPARRKYYLSMPHKSQDKLAFLSLDESNLSGTYKVIDFGMAAGTYGKWTVIYLADQWLIARTVLNSQAGESPSYRRRDVQVFKLDYTGNVIDGRTIATSNIPDFGYSQSYIAGGIPSLPPLRLERHYGDVLISGLSFEPVFPNTLTYVSSLWIPLEPATMSLRNPFWIRADRFKRAAYNEQPSINLASYEWGRIINSDSSKPWQPTGSFFVTSNLANYVSSDINEGWLKGDLNQNYSAFELVRFGSKSLDTTSSLDYNWQIEGSLLNAYKGTSSPNTFRSYVGTTSTLYGLPFLNAGSGACNLNQSNGKFNYSTNCEKFDSYYIFQPSGQLSVRGVPDALWVEYAGLNSYFGTSNGSLFLGHPDSSWGLSLDLDGDMHHPGCTSPRSYVPPTLPVTTSTEAVSLVRTTAPASPRLEGTTTISGALNVSVTPFQYRAPVLCSNYKISLDQNLTMSRSSNSSRSEISPVLHSIYSRQQIVAPVNGSYDALTNKYSPNPGFVGTDTFRIRISDRTGQQEVLISVRVL